MGGFDVYCAFCGVVAYKPYWNEDPNDDSSYDPSVLTRGDVTWMDDVRIISQNTHVESVNRVFISGPARYEDSGYYLVTPGDDSNFPNPGQLDYNHTEKPYIRAYHRDGKPALAVPFHRVCYDNLLLNVIARLSGSSASVNVIDKEILYATLKSLYNGKKEFACSLKLLDYGALRQLQKQYWFARRGQEAFVANPTRILLLNRYYDSLPLLKLHLKEEDTLPAWPTETRDIFLRLPAEVIFSIISNLEIASVNAFRTASSAAACLRLRNGFWKVRVQRDMPWLYDLPREDDGKLSDQIDWAQVYKDLWRRSNDGYKNKIHGLVNRRRIWEVCEQIATLYLSLVGADSKKSISSFSDLSA